MKRNVNNQIWGNDYSDSYADFDSDTERLERYEELGYLLKAYLEEKGVVEGKLHVRGEGSIITIYLQNVNQRMMDEIIIRGIAGLAIQYDRYIEVVPKPKKNGYCIYVIPKKKWRTCQL